MPYTYHMSDYFATQVMEWLFHNTQMPTPPAELELSLHTEGGPSLDGTNANEISETDTGYARLVIDNDADPANWSAVSIVDGWRQVLNVEDIEWGEATNVWHDGENLVDTIAVWDRETTPNLLFVIEMEPAREIHPGIVTIRSETLGAEM